MLGISSNKIVTRNVSEGPHVDVVVVPRSRVGLRLQKVVKTTSDAKSCPCVLRARRSLNEHPIRNKSNFTDPFARFPNLGLTVLCFTVAVSAGGEQGDSFYRYPWAVLSSETAGK